MGQRDPRPKDPRGIRQNIGVLGVVWDSTALKYPVGQKQNSSPEVPRIRHSCYTPEQQRAADASERARACVAEAEGAGVLSCARHSDAPPLCKVSHCTTEVVFSGKPADCHVLKKPKSTFSHLSS